MESKIAVIYQRLEVLEDKSNHLETLREEVATRSMSLQSRLDELEGMLRRNNVIFYGIPDSKESWEQTESKLTSVLNSCVPDCLSSDAVERAHRQGAFSAETCRPIIVKFTNSKTKEKVPVSRNQFRQKDISTSEDNSP